MRHSYAIVIEPLPTFNRVFSFYQLTFALCFQIDKLNQKLVHFYGIVEEMKHETCFRVMYEHPKINNTAYIIFCFIRCVNN